MMTRDWTKTSPIGEMGWELIPDPQIRAMCATLWRDDCVLRDGAEVDGTGLRLTVGAVAFRSWVEDVSVEGILRVIRDTFRAEILVESEKTPGVDAPIHPGIFRDALLDLFETDPEIIRARATLEWMRDDPLALFK